MRETIPSDFIRGVRLFENLSHDEIQQILDAAEDTRFDQDELIFSEGDRGAALHVMLEGRVSISVATPMTGKTEIAIIEPQGVFGESSFFHPAPHHASARCLTPVRLIRLYRGRYDELLSQGHVGAYKLAFNAAGILGERLQHTDEWVERMLQGRQNAELLSDWKRFRGSLRFSDKNSPGMFRP